MSKIVYRIRRKSDGLYSTGGQYPRFTVKGKIWPNKSGLHNHLSMNPKTSDYTFTPGPFGGGRYVTNDAYIDCDIVEFEISEVEKTSVSVKSYEDARQKVLDAKADKVRQRIKKCPSCNQPLATHGCSISVGRAR